MSRIFGIIHYEVRDPRFGHSMHSRKMLPSQLQRLWIWAADGSKTIHIIQMDGGL